MLWLKSHLRFDIISAAKGACISGELCGGYGLRGVKIVASR